MKPSKNLTMPMKIPVQARSKCTVDSIFEATIQVLVQIGMDRLTTTKVAERAGVSVGTLYQYFPNKTTLLTVALERHLCEIVFAVEQACESAKNKPIAMMASHVVGAFVDAKFRNPIASKALYAVASEIGSAEVVEKMSQRAQRAVSEMLATASDAQFEDLQTVGYTISTALTGPVQGLLRAGMPSAVVRNARKHLVAMAKGYLTEIAI